MVRYHKHLYISIRSSWAGKMTIRNTNPQKNDHNQKTTNSLERQNGSLFSSKQMTCGGIFFKMTGLLRREVFQDMSIIKKLSVFILFNFFLPSFHKNSFIFSSFFKEKQRERQEIQRDRDSVVSGFKLQICCFTHAHEFSMCSNHKVSGLPLKYLNINKNLHCGS